MRPFWKRKIKPKSLAWGSSFAEAEIDAYDTAVISSFEGDNERPIGSRRRDLPASDGFDSSKPSRPRRSIGRSLVSALLLLAALALLGGMGWAILGFTGIVGSEKAQVKNGSVVKVVVKAGSTSEDIAQALEKAGVIRNASVFRARLKLNGDGSQFKAGTYLIGTGSSYDSIVRKLEKGPIPLPTFDLTIPEGQRLVETAAYIDNLRSDAQREGDRVLPAFTGEEYLAVVKTLRPKPSLRAPRGTTSMEGLLFPATYELKYAASAEDFIAKQQEAFADNLAEVSLARAKKANLTPYEVVIIASLIEREARLAKERPLISAVIWNRLKIGEPLGIDASNQYEAYKRGSSEFWVRELKQSDLDRESPFNLRKVQGLPPTPIAAPSASSLQAAANPADVDYRYYVANPNERGEHFFTESYDEFLAHPFQDG